MALSSTSESVILITIYLNQMKILATFQGIRYILLSATFGKMYHHCETHNVVGRHVRHGQCFWVQTIQVLECLWKFINVWAIFCIPCDLCEPLSHQAGILLHCVYLHTTRHCEVTISLLTEGNSRQYHTPAIALTKYISSAPQGYTGTETGHWT